MKKNLVLFAALLLLGLTFPACQKDNENTKSEQVTAEDITSHNDLTEQADAEIDESIPDNFAGGVEDRGCATVTYAQPKGTWPNTITIDFGTGCNKPDGRTLKGKIIVQQSNAMNVSGAVRTVTYDNFFIENVQLTGTRTLTNTSPNAAGQPVFTKTGSEALTFPDGTQATRNIDHERTMTAGFGTPARADDVWSVTGTDTGTNRQGDPYTVTITSPLVKRAVCPWIGAGVIEFSLNGKTRSLDFGSGDCDREATLTLADGTTKTVKIRHHWWK